MIPRIAQLEDELEKRDKIIARLKKENATLKVQCFHKIVLASYQCSSSSRNL